MQYQWDEQQLVERAKGGDTSAFESLLQPLVDPAHRLACGLLQDSYLAEDAVQESALKAWRKLGNLKPGTSMRPWFLGIVANQCREARRGRWWRLTTRAQVVSNDEPPADEEALRRLRIRRALQQLNLRERQVVVLRLYLDLTWAEVAQVTGGTEAGARTRLNRALAKIRTDDDSKVVMV